MKRLAGVLVLLAGLGGCVSTEMSTDGQPPPPSGGGCGNYMSHARATQGSMDSEAHSGSHVAMAAPGLQGPFGMPVPITAPAQLHEPTGADLARAMIAQGMPPQMLQQAGFNPMQGGGSGILQAQALSCPQGGCPQGLPGGMPGMPGSPPMMTGMRPPGAVAAVGAITPGSNPAFQVQRTSVRFVEPFGMKISWFAPKEDGKPGFGAEFLTAPGSYNFPQAAIYRLKINDLPNRAIDLYPTLEVVPANAKTSTFLAHSTVPVSFTPEDIEQVVAGNYVVKVIYLPDPQYQDLAGGAEEVVSTRLDPGVDPIAEACRRGSILLVVRIGNINLELAHSPPVDAPSPWACKPPQTAAMPPIPPMAGMPGMPGMPNMSGPGNVGAPTSPINGQPGMMMDPRLMGPGMPNQLPNMQPGAMAPTSPVGKAAPAKGNGPALEQVKLLPASEAKETKAPTVPPPPTLVELAGKDTK